MLLGLALTFGYILFVWLVFFRLKWLTFNAAWAIVSAYIFMHLMLIFLVGLRFVTPYSTQARMIQHTIQLIPRLPEPTLVTAVLVPPDMPVKKGQPLFQFDRRPYAYQVQQLEAKLAHAKQNIHILKADIDVAAQKLAKAKSEMVFSKYQQHLAASLATQGAGPEEEAQRWNARLKVNEAAAKEYAAELKRVKLRYASRINGVNTSVAEVEAELALARYYLDNTTMVAPEDGHIVNLQVRPGMVAGYVRVGAIASFICDEGRYFLANFWQEDLKYVTTGQPTEVAFNLYPGQIFRGTVGAIWKASGSGQLLPSGRLPDFEAASPDRPQGQYAVKIVLDGDQSRFPIGAQGAAAIYTQGMQGKWAVLRRINIRAYSWLNWLYPVPF
jgi:multidrug resistance efflux pump